LVDKAAGVDPSRSAAAVPESEANAEVARYRGRPGVGKTHLALAMPARQLAGYSILFAPAPTLVARLAKAHSEGKLKIGFSSAVQQAEAAERRLCSRRCGRETRSSIGRCHHSQVITIRGDSYWPRREAPSELLPPGPQHSRIGVQALGSKEDPARGPRMHDLV
jgi:hypothetical protein